MYIFRINYCKHTLFGVVLLGFSALTTSAFAQTVTTYTYDAKGRVVSSTANTGDSNTITYDDAGNITKAIGADGGSGNGNGGGTNNPPTCSNITTGTTQTYAYMNGLQSCSDPDGDTLTLVSVTNPPGPGTASVASNNQIYFQNLPCDQPTTTSRTVSDGNGGTATSNATVWQIGCGGWNF